MPLIRTAINVGQRYHIPIVFDMRENWPEMLISMTNYRGIKKILLGIVSKMYKLLEKLACKHCDYIIVVVDEQKERLVNLGIQKEKIQHNCLRK